MSKAESEKILRVPMDPQDFETVKEWQRERGLTNPGVGQRLAAAIEEGRMDERE